MAAIEKYSFVDCEKLRRFKQKNVVKTNAETVQNTNVHNY